MAAIAQGTGRRHLLTNERYNKTGEMTKIRDWGD